MYLSQNFQRGAILIWSVISLMFFLPTIAMQSALASNADLQSESIPQSVLNLDLCTLSYQLYHQSLCLPLDPWYDMMSRVGSDRRTNICKFTHDYAQNLGGYYSGPNAARGFGDSNFNLDPILSNYKYIDAQLPTFNRDGEIFLALQAPSYITQNIKTIEGVRYKSRPTSYPHNDTERFSIRQYPGGDDHIVVFEGGTGNTGTIGGAGATDPSWSLMGFVMMKKTASGYDAHIVFRGSRSGSSLLKTVWRAQNFIGEPKGNPDWITDLRGMKQVEQPLISKVGKVTQGFSESLPTMLGTITASCKHLEQTYGAPEHIYITGHSLGAGLATQFLSAVMQGSYGDELRQEVKSWPWQNATLVAYAQPIPGDPIWAANFDKLTPSSQHYWVAGDSVVEATSGRIIGMIIDKGEHSGIQKKLEMLSDCTDNPHEVFVIRAALGRDLHLQMKENNWGYYENFSKMLKGQPKSYVIPGTAAPKFITEENLRTILRNCDFSSNLENWLEQSYARMIVDKSSYIGPKFQSTLDERKKLVLDIVSQMRTSPPNDNLANLANLENDYKLVDDTLGLSNEEQWIYCGMILSRLQNSGLTLQELESKSIINACLDSKFE
ncbi:hypothetical protein KA183_05725 [bacterium]|nr:hypothetical protein [bacterium]